MHGKFVFTRGKGQGSVIQEGSINIREGGYLVLLAPQVRNSGKIFAPFGFVALASGEQAVVGLDDDRYISVVVPKEVSITDDRVGGKPVPAKVSGVFNTGSIVADGGTISMTAGVLNDVLNNAVNNSGLLQANDIKYNNGRIELVAQRGDVINSGSVVAGDVKISASNDVRVENVKAKRTVGITAGRDIIGTSFRLNDIEADTLYLEAAGAIYGVYDPRIVGAQDQLLMPMGSSYLSTNVKKIHARAGGLMNLYSANGTQIISAVSGGDMRITANGSLVLGTLSAEGRIALYANGNINDDANDTTFISATDLFLNAGMNIGAAGAGALDTAVDTLTAASSSSGNIFINEKDALTLTSATTGSGTINVIAGGAMNVRTVTTTNGVTLTSTTGDITLGNISAVDNTITVRAYGNIRDDGDAATVLQARNIDMTAGGNIGSGAALGAVGTDAETITLKAGGDVFLNEKTGAVFTLTTANGSAHITANGASTLKNANVQGDLFFVSTVGDLIFSGTNRVTGSADIAALNGHINGSGAGTDLVTGGDAYLRAPKGSIGVGTPVNVDVGRLFADIGARIGSISGFFTGAVHAAPGIPLLLGSSYPNPLYPGGNVYFNGIRIWPSALTNQLSQQNGTVIPGLTLAYATQGYGNPGTVYSYHPISEVDSSAFDNISLDQGAYEFIDGQIKDKCSDEDRRAGRCKGSVIQ
jgi:hypothetical protein